MEFKIVLKNNSSVASGNVAFLTENQATSQLGSTYTFTLPYKETYVHGEFFRINLPDKDYYVYITENTTREQLVDKLDQLTFGDWSIDPSILNNIFKCFCATTVNYLELDYYWIAAPISSAATSITINSFSANWSAVTLANKYYLDVATDSGFNNMVTGYNNLDVGNVNTYSVSGLALGTNYYYRVRAHYSIKSITSSNSNTIIATTLTIPQWAQLSSGETVALNEIRFINNTGFVCGNLGKILKTINGGLSWADKSTTSSYTIKTLYVFDSLNAIVGVGGSGTSGSFILFITSDGGSNWNQISTSHAGTCILNSIYFINSLTGWFCGYSNNTGGESVICITTNGGTTWTAQTITLSTPLNNIFFIDANNGWCVGNSGIASRTVNSGLVWSSQILGLFNINSVFFINSNIGWLCGNSGKIYKTTNKGVSWVLKTSGVLNDLKSIYFIDANNGWCVGSSGVILVTTDGGETWIVQNSGISSSLNNIYMLSSILGYACGDSGKILKYS